MRNDNTYSSLISVLERVHGFAKSSNVLCYLVGGMLRDQLLERPCDNLNADIVIAKGAIDFTRALAHFIHGAFVLLDEKQGSARIVIREDERCVELDITDLRAASLEEDLRLRDFTINAIAIKLEDWLRSPKSVRSFIDPLGAKEALKRRALIACFPGTFLDDPLRIMRAHRFAAQIGLTFDRDLPRLMRGAVSDLSEVSGERIRDELMAIFETYRAGEMLISLKSIGALDVLIPELIPGRGMDQGGYHHLDVLDHQLEAVSQADRILADLGEFSEPLRVPMQAYCAEQPVEKRSRRGLIKLGVLLHDVGKPYSRQVHPDGEIWFIGHERKGAELAASIADRLKFSNREANTICQLVRHHLRPGFLSREAQLTRRAIYRFYKDLRDDGAACCLEWWADRLATRGPYSNLAGIDSQRSFLEELLGAYFFKAEAVVNPPRLIDGHRLMEALGLKPAPLVGKLLAAIEEAQAEGRIASSDAALDLARKQLASERRK